MAEHVRVSVTIDGTRLNENDISNTTLYQPMGSHHNFTIHLGQNAVSNLMGGKATAWIGKPITIGFDYISDLQLLMSPPQDRFVGVVTEVAISRRDGETSLIVKGNSPTISLSDHPITRSFTQKNLKAIVNEVVKSHAGKFQGIKIDPKQHDEAIPYSVQYQESNFNYLNRIASWYGEWCYYNGKEFIFGDDPSAREAIKMDFSQEGLVEFNVSSKTLPGKFEVKAYDYEVADINTELAPNTQSSDASGQTAISASNSTVYDEAISNHIGMSMNVGELKRIAKRTEQISQGSVTMATGSSRNPNLGVGSVITVGDAMVGDAYGDFVITSISHSVSQGGDYMNGFEAISAEAKIPVVNFPVTMPNCSNQLATVTNLADDKGLGRVKVKFQWQEGTSEESPWMRVCTPYMGGEKGFYIIPEVDDQVMVAFEENHPEYPYVLTGMYHGKAKPQWFDAGNRYKGFHSRGNNIMKFDDDSRHILLSAPSAMDIFAGTTINMKTGGKADSSITIDTGDGTINISAKTINITAAETIQVQSGKVIDMNSDQSFTANAGDSMSTTSGSSMDISTTDLTINGSSSVAMDGSKIDVKGGATVNVTGGKVDIN